MHSRFWKSLVWGGVIAAALNAILRPMVHPRRKPLVERSAEAIRDTTRELMHEARRARRRIMRNR